MKPPVIPQGHRDEVVVFSGADPRQVKIEQRSSNHMARLIGTGKDPAGSHVEGQMFDVRSDDPLYQELIDKGYAKAHDGLVETKDAEVLETANAVVRGDLAAHPREQKIADQIEGNEHAIVHQQDPGAKGSGQPDDKRTPKASREAAKESGANTVAK